MWQCRNYIHNGRNLTKQDCKNSRETEPEEGWGCDNIHLDEERLSAILEKAAGQYSDVAKADVSEITGIIMQILTETLEQDDPAGQVKHLKKEAERYAGQKQRLLEKLLEDVITDEDYKEKRSQIEQKIENINHQLEKLNDAGSTQNIPEQRLEKIQKRLADGAVRQAEIEVMLDYIEEIEVFPSRLVLTCKPEMHGAEKNPRIEIPLDADFQYASRKESENQRILDYMHDNPRITAKMIAEKEGISLSANYQEKLKDLDGIIIPGGFGDRGIEGMILACKYARENNLPYFGICLGMQITVIEYARNVLGLNEADSREFNENAKDKVIDYMLPGRKKPWNPYNLFGG